MREHYAGSMDGKHGLQAQPSTAVHTNSPCGKQHVAWSGSLVLTCPCWCLSAVLPQVTEVAASKKQQFSRERFPKVSSRQPVQDNNSSSGKTQQEDTTNKLRIAQSKLQEQLRKLQEQRQAEDKVSQRQAVRVLASPCAPCSMRSDWWLQACPDSSAHHVLTATQPAGEACLFSCRSESLLHARLTPCSPLSCRSSRPSWQLVRQRGPS
jgi:hypothetical protein